MSHDWPLWEVFIRSKGGLSHKHVGSVNAPKGNLPCVMRATSIPGGWKASASGSYSRAISVASDPDQSGPMFEPAETKIYRHPTFYDIPDAVGHM